MGERGKERKEEINRGGALKMPLIVFTEEIQLRSLTEEFNNCSHFPLGS